MEIRFYILSIVQKPFPPISSINQGSTVQLLYGVHTWW